MTDALSQVKTYAYAQDDRLSGITYTGAVNPSPNVSFTYDPYFPRLTAMTDGTGTRQYTYVPVGSPGALQLQQDSGPLPSSAITAPSVALGRLSQRTVQGAGAETFQYDAIGRLSAHTDDRLPRSDRPDREPPARQLHPRLQVEDRNVVMLLRLAYVTLYPPWRASPSQWRAVKVLPCPNDRNAMIRHSAWASAQRKRACVAGKDRQCYAWSVS